LRPQLACQTDPRWVRVIVENFDEFLIDHASCERKAMAFAMACVTKYPDRSAIIPDLLQVVREELEHFTAVYELLEQRGLKLGPDQPDLYVNRLIGQCRHGRDARLLDRLLVAAIIETRGAERFRLISEALDDARLKAFYRDLWAGEARHGDVFTGMAHEYFAADVVNRRVAELVRHEAEIVGSLAWRPSLH